MLSRHFAYHVMLMKSKLIVALDVDSYDRAAAPHPITAALRITTEMAAGN